MAESKKTNTNALDVGAMYQIGAAGAGAKKAGNEGLRMLQRIGEFAIGFKLKSIENFKQVQSNSNQAFDILENSILEHDLDLNEQTLDEVKKIKGVVTEANKTMTSMKYSWRPGSEEYEQASKDKTNALLNLKKLEKANKSISTEFKDILEISNGERFEKGQDGNQYQVKLFGTEEEMYNASLVVSGQFSAAREWDSGKGEYVINMQLLGDNPDTKDVDESTLGKVALSEFKFARQNNPSQTDPGSAYITKLINLGASGKNMTSSSILEFTSNLKQDLDRFGNRDFSELMEIGTIIRDDVELSYIDAIVEDELGTALEAIKGGITEGDEMIDNPSYVEDGDAPEKILESELYALSIIGAKETIKNEIINASPNSEYVDGFKKKVKSLVETNAKERYEEEFQNFEKEKKIKENKTNRPDYSYDKSETSKIKKITEKGSGTYVRGGVTYKLAGGKWSGGGSNYLPGEFINKMVSKSFYQYAEKRKDRSDYSWMF